MKQLKDIADIMYKYLGTYIIFGDAPELSSARLSSNSDGAEGFQLGLAWLVQNLGQLKRVIFRL